MPPHISSVIRSAEQPHLIACNLGTHLAASAPCAAFRNATDRVHTSPVWTTCFSTLDGFQNTKCIRGLLRQFIIDVLVRTTFTPCSQRGERGNKMWELSIIGLGTNLALSLFRATTTKFHSCLLLNRRPLQNRGDDNNRRSFFFWSKVVWWPVAPCRSHAIQASSKNVSSGVCHYALRRDCRWPFEALTLTARPISALFRRSQCSNASHCLIERSVLHAPRLQGPAGKRWSFVKAGRSPDVLLRTGGVGGASDGQGTAAGHGPFRPHCKTQTFTQT